MPHVPKTRVEHPRFPVIDVHAHLSWSSQVRSGVSVGEEVTPFATPEALRPVMDRKGIKTLVNPTGGIGAGLEKVIRSFDLAAPGRFITLTAPSWEYFPEPNFAQRQADAIARHSKTTFALLRVGNHAENLAGVAACLDRYPNTVIDISARIGELGRQPRIAQRFFDRYQDRILFGTEAGPRRGATMYHSSCSATNSTRSTTASWKPRPSTLTMRQVRFHHRVAGPFTVSD
jgi:hypothetical protein